MMAKISEGDSLVILDEMKRALGVAIGDTLFMTSAAVNYA